MKKIFVMIMLGLPIGCKKEGNPITSEQEAQQYFPLAKGNMWVYNNTSDYSGSDTTVSLTVKLDSPYTQNGIRWYGVNQFCDGDKMTSPLPLFCAEWARDGNKVLTITEHGPALYNPEVVLDFPLFAGEKWTIKSLDTTYGGPDNSTYQFIKKERQVKGVESITVPTGTFANAWHIEDSSVYVYQYSSLHGTVINYKTKTISNEWFVANIGMVKQVIEYTYEDFVLNTITHSTGTNLLRSYDVRLSN